MNAAGKSHRPVVGTTLVFGGTRSGKSEFAERLVYASGLKPVYLATARSDDDEMSERIEIHRQRRRNISGIAWRTVEEPLALGDALRNCAFDGHCVMIDCLTLWISNLMVVGANVEREITDLAACLDQLRGPVVMVSNEVGMGIVPQNAMAREFRDLAGMVNQKIAGASNHVYFIAAGLPLVMKSEEF